MKVAIIALGLCVLIAIVKSENCTDASDCRFLACAGSETCEGGTCTCESKHGNACTTRNDCVGMMHGHCRQDSEHCVDGHCRCTHH